MELISSLDLSIGYNKNILRQGINFSLIKGEVLQLSGPNGSGKSTLIKTILGEIPSLSGSIKKEISICIKHLPQLISYDLPLSVTLGEVVDSFGVDRREIGFLDANFYNRRWCSASGGEKQKTLILTRLGQKCDVLILDEPFNHVDQEGIREISDFLVDLLECDRVHSLIIVSHITPLLRNNKAIKKVIL